MVPTNWYRIAKVWTVFLLQTYYETVTFLLVFLNTKATIPGKSQNFYKGFKLGRGDSVKRNKNNKVQKLTFIQNRSLSRY